MRLKTAKRQFAIARKRLDNVGSIWKEPPLEEYDKVSEKYNAEVTRRHEKENFAYDVLQELTGERKRLKKRLAKWKKERSRN